jgi:hypothetical protein
MQNKIRVLIGWRHLSPVVSDWRKKLGAKKMEGVVSCVTQIRTPTTTSSNSLNIDDGQKTCVISCEICEVKLNQ